MSDFSRRTKQGDSLPECFKDALIPGMAQSEIDWTQNLLPRWSRLCWWLSRQLGGRSVFGKRDLT